MKMPYSYYEIVQATFPSLLGQLRSNGYAEISNTDPDISTMELAQELSVNIGTIVSESAASLVASPIGAKPQNTYGGNYGYGRLPLHTDLAHWYRPPRYVLLRCIIGAQSVTTHLLHRHQLKRWIPGSVMQRALFSPRRRLEGKMFLMKMQTEKLLRWDQLFLKPQNTAAHAVVACMQAISSALPIIDVVLSRPGQTLLIDNWNILHGRSAVPADERNRKLERVYLEESSNGNKAPS